MQSCENSSKCVHLAENGQPVGTTGNIRQITKKWTFHKYHKYIVFIKNHKETINTFLRVNTEIIS